MEKNYFNNEEICGSVGITDQKPDVPWNKGDSMEILFLEMMPAIKRADYNLWYDTHMREKQNTEKMGLPYTMPAPDYKNLGIRWRFVVLSYTNGEGKHDVVKIDETGKLVVPNYQVTGYIEQLTPTQIYEKGLKFGENKLGMNNGDSLAPVLGYLPASNEPVSRWEKIKDNNGVEKNTKIPVTSINTNDPKIKLDWAKELEDESVRKDAWAEYIRIYNSLSADKALESLLHRLSRYYLICEYDDTFKKWMYFRPETGMVLQTGCQNPSFNQVTPFMYNKSIKKNEFFASQLLGGYHVWVNPYMSDEMISLANRFLEYERNEYDKQTDFP